MKIYFTDYFGVDKNVLDKYGALNISLINDLPLFIDPFLLFTSKKKEYCQLHKQIIDYLIFLKNKSSQENINRGLLSAWYMFPEVKQLWLGYCLNGNEGSGLGIDFAESLNKNLHVVFANFGSERITKTSHLEKVCLIDDGIGRDNISDFTANLIKEYLLEYTQKFAQKYISQNLRRKVSVPSVYFDYKFERWLPKEYDLPYLNNDYVLLTPRDILTRDENWINRSDLILNFERIALSIPDKQLLAQVNQYLSGVLLKDKKKESTKKEKEKAFSNILRKYPKIIEYYIRSKEDRGNEAIRTSNLKVEESETFFISQVVDFCGLLCKETDFYKRGINTLSETKTRVAFLKTIIENNDGYRLLYNKGKPICKESDLQILFKFVWLGSPSDFNSEVNNGQGPVDFKISRGSKDKTLVEFKLAKSTKLKQNLKNQIGIYEKANNTNNSLKVIFYFSAEEKSRIESILKELKIEKDDSIVLIDARNDNKPSASNAK